jgi:hypothetical protein
MKKIIIILVVLAIVGGVIGYYMYNKPHAEVATATPVADKSADEWAELFNADAEGTLAQYVDKIISVNGVVEQISLQADQATVLLELSAYPGSNIKCGMDPAFSSSWEGIESGSGVVIKGFLVGYDQIEGLGTDIELSRAVLIIQ